MQFILLHNNQVMLGPMGWNRQLFEYDVEMFTEMKLPLPQVKDDYTPIKIGEEIVIKGAVLGEKHEPVTNPLSRMAAGPFWDMSGEVAVYWYTCVEQPIDIAKRNYKQRVSEYRWRKEEAGITIDVGDDKDLFVPTDRLTRFNFTALHFIGPEELRWKFGDRWVMVTAEDCSLISKSVLEYVQEQFDQEHRLHALIDDAQTVDDLEQSIENDDVFKEWRKLDGQTGV